MAEICNECLQKPILDGCDVTYCKRCGKKIVTLHTPGDTVCIDCIKKAQKDGVHLCKCCGKEISVIPTDNYEKTVVKPTGRSRAYLRRVKKRNSISLSQILCSR